MPNRGDKMKNILRLRPHGCSGKLIVLEGTDGAGKTTMLKNIVQYLKESGKSDIVVTRQPTERVRRSKLFRTMMYTQDPGVSYRAVQLMTMSDRIEHQTEVILPALRSGKTVICDRYIYTSAANMLARGYSNEKWFFDTARELVRPDAVILAHAAPELAIKRILSRENEKDRYLDRELLKAVYKEFMAMSRRYSFYTVDTQLPEETNRLLVQGIVKEVMRGA